MSGERSENRFGLMGGTFNPVHMGHLRAAEEIAESLELGQVHLIPAASPPHKSQEPLVDYRHRLEMLKLAVADRPDFQASDLESRLPFPSYTVNTLRAFKNLLNPGAELFFLVGLDSFLSIATWHDYRTLFTLASFVVFGRAGLSAGPEELRHFLLGCLDQDFRWNQDHSALISEGRPPIYYRPSCRLEISSTDLRQRLESGASVRYLVPEMVRHYIEKNNLYRS